MKIFDSKIKLPPLFLGSFDEPADSMKLLNMRAFDAISGAFYA